MTDCKPSAPCGACDHCIGTPFQSFTPPVSALEAFETSLLDNDGIRSLPPPEWLIADYLAQDSLALLYGPSGTSKTFLALDWAMHVSTGLWWHGHEVKQGRVLYVIAEGARGIGRRIDAWEEHHEERMSTAGLWDGTEVIDWRPEALNLFDPLAVAPLILAAMYRRPALIVFDTLARCTLGAEENSAKDMGQVVAALDQIRTQTKACVLLVHHTGKDAANGARGSSALKAAMDTELEITAVDHRLVVKVTKQKDDEEARPLKLNRVNVGDSCVLVSAGNPAVTEEVGASAMETLASLREIEVPGGIPASAWELACTASRRAFYRYRAELLAHGLVRNVGTDSRPRYVVAEISTQEEGSDDDIEEF